MIDVLLVSSLWGVLIVCVCVLIVEVYPQYRGVSWW